MCISRRCSVCQNTVSVRRVYTAKLEGRGSGHMTVAMYEGERAEEAWNQHLTKYEAVRHPYVMQLYGLVNTKMLRGMVFHDELIPYRQFLNCFQHSPILSTYILGYCNTEFHEATNYLFCALQMREIILDDLQAWIRLATGELCLDLVQDGKTNFKIPLASTARFARLENKPLDDPDAEAVITSNVDEDGYHDICSQTPMARWRSFAFVSDRLPIPQGPTIFRCDNQQRMLSPITEPLDLGYKQELYWDVYGDQEGEVLANSWMRYDSRQICDLAFKLAVVRLPHSCESPQGPNARFWMAQANHIFAMLQTTSDFDPQDYVYVDVDGIEFIFGFLPNPCNNQEPEGHLFICPPDDFRFGANSLQWPLCPAYWSLDPSGTTRLSSQDAKNLGFPLLQFEKTRMLGYSWDSSVYEGLRQLHAAKGFNPDSQDVADSLDYPLFELSKEVLNQTQLAYETFCDVQSCIHLRC
ncbi:hypothetical protein C8R45DRAFT_1024010 [Mycena sanguinolenta]|nr:hypothetical protein C8R45DRAFT_1024010 [Mycena sanguinolenta]